MRGCVTILVFLLVRTKKQDILLLFRWVNISLRLLHRIIIQLLENPWVVALISYY